MVLAYPYLFIHLFSFYLFTLPFLAVKPQVTFASLSSPAVMDIRRLLALASDKVERGDARLR